ncbi:MAG: Tim44 domain-containing protein [Rhodocyclaceae bacterium]|nr:Tim44 domain-containing protein [Rhodocyclaceae bacterium]MBX3668128.1 Tim44 domain-containing protein [Rhodocyclaceae bacterium]
MTRLFLVAFAVFALCAGVAEDAEARRLGGGKSFGMQRDPVVRRDAAAPSSSPQQAAAAPGAADAAAAAPRRSGLGAMLGGLALGAGLAWLFGGSMGGIFGLLIFGLLVFVAMRVAFALLRRRQPAQGMQYAGAGPGPYAQRVEPSMPAPLASASRIPDGFDVDNFLRQAKLNFARLQAANDAGNVAELRHYMTPKLHAELLPEIEAKARHPQQTDVVSLDAELLEIATEPPRHVASVRFFGTLREDRDAAPQAFEEVWHLEKPIDGTHGWLLAGIQQAA